MASNQPKQTLGVGLDAGASRTRCVIVAVEHSDLRFLGYGDAPAKGWTRGRVADPMAIAGSIQYAVRDAERMAGVPVDSVVVGVGGGTVQGFASRGVYEFGRPRQRLEHLSDVRRPGGAGVCSPHAP